MSSFQLVVVVYVMVILWLVSANFRSAAANVASAGAGFGYTASSSGGLLGAVMGGMALAAAKNAGVPEAEEAEALLVMQDDKGGGKPRTTTNFDDEFEGEPV